MKLIDKLNSKKSGLKTVSGSVEKDIEKTAAATAATPAVDQMEQAREQEYQKIKGKIHGQIIDLPPEELEPALNAGGFEVRKLVEGFCNRAEQEDPFAIPAGHKTRLINELISEIIGLGPIEELVKDQTISEIMVNGYNSIYVERKGKLVKTSVKFKDDEHLLHIIDRIVSAVGRRVDESSPLCDARLLDGSRVNVIIPPLALSGPTLTIRKFSKDKLTIDNLIGFGSMSPNMAKFLEAAVQGSLNIVVSGGTGSGKTTLLNCLSSFIPADERIVTIEDSAELQLKQDHVVTLETRPANIEGKGAISMRDLVKNALRMRPDRIVVGEVRGGEALDMLQAMNTGHDGSMTTGHANTARDILARFETMVLMSGMELPIKAIRSQIASAIDIIVQIARLRDGSRKVISITEVSGMEGDIITTQDLFKFEQQGMNENKKIYGRFKGCGLRPLCFEKLTTNGVEIDMSIFKE